MKKFLLLVCMICLACNYVWAQAHDNTSRCRLSKANVIRDSDPDCSVCKAEDLKLIRDREQKIKDNKAAYERKKAADDEANRKLQEQERQKNKDKNTTNVITIGGGANSSGSNSPSSGSNNNGTAAPTKTPAQLAAEAAAQREQDYKANVTQMDDAMVRGDYAAAQEALRKANAIKPVDNYSNITQSINILERSRNTGSALSAEDQRRADDAGATIANGLNALIGAFSGPMTVARYEVAPGRAPEVRERKQNEHIDRNIEKQKKATNVKSDIDAMNFTQNDINGNPVTFSSFKGKYVILVFWASWSPPSVQEMISMSALYSRYKSKNVALLSVSLDYQMQHWADGIQKYNLQGTHVSDLKMWKNKAAKMFGVNAVPFICLIDDDGNIVGRNMRGADIETRLNEIMQ